METPLYLLHMNKEVQVKFKDFVREHAEVKNPKLGLTVNFRRLKISVSELEKLFNTSRRRQGLRSSPHFTYHTENDLVIFWNLNELNFEFWNGSQKPNRKLSFWAMECGSQAGYGRTVHCNVSSLSKKSKQTLDQAQSFALLFLLLRTNSLWNATKYGSVLFSRNMGFKYLYILMT